MRVFLCAAALALSVSAANAAVLTSTVTAQGPFGNSLSELNDGYIPPNFYSYNGPNSVYYGPGDFGQNATFTFNFEGLANVVGFTASVDNNDTYTFSFFDGEALVGSAQILGSEGGVSFGLEAFSRNLATPVKATRAVVSTAGGDLRFGLGEVQFSGSLVSGAVPEPSTWAMMIAGFAGLGAVMRRKATTATA